MTDTLPTGSTGPAGTGPGSEAGTEPTPVNRSAARILADRDHCVAMVAADSIDALTTRVMNLLAHRRRITLVSRYTHDTNGIPDVPVGLSLFEPPKPWKHHDPDDAGTVTAAGLTVKLTPGIHGFGFAWYAADGYTTEAEARRPWCAAPEDNRCNFTEITITGGLPGDGPARDDRVVIRRWNSNSVCLETVVRFDYDARGLPDDDAVDHLTHGLRAALRDTFGDLDITTEAGSLRDRDLTELAGHLRTYLADAGVHLTRINW